MPNPSDLNTPLYAAIAALILVALSVRTLLLRRRYKVAIGSGENPVLERAIRAHGNFAEYVPIALLLLFFLELAGSSDLIVHGLGLLLILGRSLHAYGVSQVNENYAFRVAGMAMTFTVIASIALLLIAAYAGLIPGS